MWDNVFADEKPGKIYIDIPVMGEADFGAAVVLITFGAVLGKLNAF